MYNSAFSNLSCKTQKTRCITPVSQGLFSSIVAGQKYPAPQKVRNQSVLQKRQKTYILNFIAIFQQFSATIYDDYRSKHQLSNFTSAVKIY